LAAALLLVVKSAVACPCSDEAGSAGSLVREDERYAVALAASARRALGRVDAFGHYRSLEAGEGELGEELLLRAGVRVPRRWEWLAELGYSAYRLHAPGFVERQSGVGDALVRLRYSALDEAMPHAAFPAPGLLLALLVRVPLGAVESDAGTSLGSGGAPRGLGAWEVGAGAELKRSLMPTLELWLGGEAAYRFEDHALGRARRLGPRVEAAVGGRALVAPWLASTLALRLRTVADVELDGRSLPGTSERLWSVVVGLAVYDRPRRFRSAVTLSVDPPVLARGSTAAAALGLSLALGFR
jgi:hypothetical protein